MARRSRTDTRMEKHVELAAGSVALGAPPALYTFQLENGDEECQIKRLCLSIAANNQCRYAFGLFQDTPSVIAFTDDKVIYSFCGNAGAVGLINETTTVRVPRGWHLAVMVTNQGSGAVDFTVNTQLNYLVLS